MRRRVAVVFVNFHSEALIAPRARRLLEEGFEVLVADNSATFPAELGISTVTTGSNLGFASGCNVAARSLGAEVDTLCFHNPDVDIAPGAIKILADKLDAQRRPGLVAPAEAEGNRVRLNGYHYPGPLREYAAVARRLRRMKRGVNADATATEGSAAPPVWMTKGGRRFASAALLVADAGAFRTAGGFDGRYFMYGEDLDLWHRLGLLGFDREFAPEVTARHGYAQGSPLSQAQRELYRWVGVELFVALNGTGAWPAYRWVHRRFLPAITPMSPETGRSIASLWARGANPEEVAKVLFPEMAGYTPGAVRMRAPEGSEPLVTVGIPCYNYGAFVAEAVESALNQTHPRIEVIVVDDGSTDDSAAVVASFGGRVSLLTQANAGPQSGRNRAAREANGEYIVFLDADDILMPDFVTRALTAFQQDDDPSLGFVYTQMEMFGRSDGVTAFPRFEVAALLRENFIHASALLRTDLVRQHPYDASGRFGLEDWDFYLSLCERGYRGKLVDAPLLKYRKHDSAQSRYDSLRRRDRDLLRIKLAWKHRGLYLRSAPSFLSFVGGKLAGRSLAMFRR